VAALRVRCPSHRSANRLAISLIVALLVPLYTIRYQYPAFTQSVKESVNMEPVTLAGRTGK
jgi:hypothetical protein